MITNVDPLRIDGVGVRDRLPKEAGLFFSLIKDIISSQIDSFGGRQEPPELEARIIYGLHSIGRPA